MYKSVNLDKSKLYPPNNKMLVKTHISTIELNLYN